MIGTFGMIFGQGSYNGGLSGARNMSEAERAALSQQMMAMRAREREMEQLFRCVPVKPTPPLKTPDREPVPSLCCLNGRWL